MEEQNEQTFHHTADESYYVELVNKANELKNNSDWQYVAMEFENIRTKWSEGPELDVDRKKELYAEIIAANELFSQTKKDHYEKQQERKKINLERREGYLEKLRAIVEAKRWSAFNEVYSIQKKFEETRPLPVNADVQNEEFNKLMDIFNEGKVEYLVKARQKEEENLMIKLAILDKMESIIKTISKDTKDWVNVEKEIEGLSTQWKKVGRVVKEKSDEAWERYKSLRDQYFGLKMEFNSEYRGELEKNLKVKTSLCEKAEALLNEKDLAVASKEINLLNKRWKETGPVLREKSDELWERFKTVIDKFSEIRNENLDTIREIEQKNLELKEALCEKAEQIAQTEGAEEQREIIEKLFQQWNAIGPIPKRKTKKIWARFKKAIDSIQDQRRSFFKHQRVEQKENLAKKRAFIDKIIELASAENLEEALPEVKQIQSDFQSVGFVPIKQKNKIWDEYRSACDVFFKALRATGSHSKTADSTHSHSSGSAPRSEVKIKQQELYKLKKECDKLNDIILQYADTKTYIKPNKKGIALIEEIQQKIDVAKEELNQKSEELERIRQEIESMS
ncbi:MAG TPA: hypothetical protein DCE78_00140 [Bacteroidetes bacterium]|nr:hypothetical protein [Bacteroidota bacterium]